LSTFTNFDKLIAIVFTFFIPLTRNTFLVNIGSEAYEKRHETLTKDNMQKAIKQASSSVAQTSCLEGYNSVINHEW